MTSSHSFGKLLLAAVTLALLLVSAIPSEAGPPLICQRFDTNGAPSLPWGEGDAWNAPLSSYDVNKLTGDTLRLLTPATPVRARMETIRRATLYAAQDGKVASQLLTAILARALDTAAGGTVDPHALFDAGYLVESYRQASLVYQWNMLGSGERGRWALKDGPAGLDGYAWVRQAVALAGRDKDMAFAATLMQEGAPATARR